MRVADILAERILSASCRPARVSSRTNSRGVETPAGYRSATALADSSNRGVWSPCVQTRRAGDQNGRTVIWRLPTRSASESNPAPAESIPHLTDEDVAEMRRIQVEIEATGDIDEISGACAVPGRPTAAIARRKLAQITSRFDLDLDPAHLCHVLVGEVRDAFGKEQGSIRSGSRRQAPDHGASFWSPARRCFARKVTKPRDSRIRKASRTGIRLVFNSSASSSA